MNSTDTNVIVRHAAQPLGLRNLCAPPLIEDVIKLIFPYLGTTRAIDTFAGINKLWHKISHEVSPCLFTYYRLFKHVILRNMKFHQVDNLLKLGVSKWKVSGIGSSIEISPDQQERLTAGKDIYEIVKKDCLQPNKTPTYLHFVLFMHSVLNSIEKNILTFGISQYFLTSKYCEEYMSKKVLISDFTGFFFDDTINWIVENSTGVVSISEFQSIIEDLRTDFPRIPGIYIEMKLRQALLNKYSVAFHELAESYSQANPTSLIVSDFNKKLKDQLEATKKQIEMELPNAELDVDKAWQQRASTDEYHSFGNSRLSAAVGRRDDLRKAQDKIVNHLKKLEEDPMFFFFQTAIFYAELRIPVTEDNCKERYNTLRAIIGK